MSKKTITFTMPGQDAHGSKDRPSRDMVSRDGRAAPISPPVEHDASAANSDRSDLWVEHRDADRAVDQAPGAIATSLPAPVAMARATLDVTAERSLHEVAALAFIVPPMLGWFWLYNALNRIASRWAS